MLYHVIARGNHKQLIFRSAQDYRIYLDRFAVYTHRYVVEPYAYCLMPNHVHLLIRPTQTSLSKVMQGLQQSYTQYFNLAYETVGHLFQGRYRALHCDVDRYLAALVRYIHLNPVRAGLVARPEDYPYSSHNAYLTGRPTRLVEPQRVLAMLGGPAAYRRLMTEADEPSELEVLARWPEPAERVPSPPRPVAGTGRAPVAQAIGRVAVTLGVLPAALSGPDRGREVALARGVAAYTLVRRLGYPPSEVAAALGRPVASLSVLLSRIAARIDATPALHAESNRLVEMLRMLRSDPALTAGR